MKLEQFYLQCLAQASYLIGDEETGVGIVVDPRRDVDVYIEAASRSGLRIEHVFLTHFHADFASGHLELRNRCDAEIHLGADAQPEYPFSPARDEDSWTFGNLRLTVRETPGHTPESVCILVHDRTKDSTTPHAILTGDTLFIGDVGRPDLMASVGHTQEDLAGLLYDSTREKILSLPDATLVYPGHGAGSMCGKNLSSETVSTIGQQRRFNYALQEMTRDAFIALVCAGQSTPPRYFGFDAAFNKREHPLLEDSLRAMLTRITPEEAMARATEGSTLIDIREPGSWSQGHLRGSLCVGLDGRYATWVGTVVAPDAPIILVAPSGYEEEAARRLGRIGFDHVQGYVSVEEDLFHDHPELSATHHRIDAEELAIRLASEDAPLLVDVRQPGEYADGHIEGAVSVPLVQLATDPNAAAGDRPVILQCQTGYRSVLAASLLRRAGRLNVMDLEGGFEAWSEGGRTVTTPDKSLP